MYVYKCFGARPRPRNEVNIIQLDAEQQLKRGRLDFLLDQEIRDRFKDERKACLHMDEDSDVD